MRMKNKRMEVSKDEALYEVVTRLVDLQKRIASDCRQLASDVNRPVALGLKPKEVSAKHGGGKTGSRTSELVSGR